MLYGEHATCQAEAEYPELWQGLVGAWSPCLSPRGGTVLRDLSGRGNHGTLTNMDPATDWVMGDGYAAIDFDAVNDRVLVSHNPSLSMTRSISVVACIKTTTTSNVYVACKAEDSFFLAIGPSGTTADRCSFYLNGVSAAWLQGTTSVADNAWHMIAATWDGAVKTVYKDGNAEASTARTGTILTGTASLEIGSRNGSWFSSKQMRDVMLYDRCLRAASIKKLWELGAGGWATPRRRRWNYATAQTAIPYWVFARKNARLIGGGVT